MKEPILQVLAYLFEYYFSLGQVPCHDPDILSLELKQAGFRSEEIDRAFDWLAHMTDLNENTTMTDNFPHAQGTRIFAPAECRKLRPECRGFIISLEQQDILNPMTREWLIDGLMSLETNHISIEQLKWVVLMVLSNQKDNEQNNALLETIMFSTDAPVN